MRKWRLALVIITMLLAVQWAAAQQQSAAPKPQPTPAPPKAESTGCAPFTGAFIVGFHIDEADSDSGYETGPLHIQYTDGCHIVQELPAKRESTAAEAVYNQEGFANVQLAADQQTLGWLELIDNCCTSYAVPQALVFFRGGKVLHAVTPGQMIYNWAFLDGGKRAGLICGTVHGKAVNAYQLYDVRSGKMLAETHDDPTTEKLPANAPAWTKELARLVEEQHKKLK